MKELIIEAAYNTPFIHFDPGTGEMRIEGRSIPENPDDLYMRLIKWLHSYFEEPCPLTRAILKLEYVNSGSSKFLLEILRIMSKHHEQGKKCEVDWYYEEEDERIMELGYHFESTTELPFNMHIIY